MKELRRLRCAAPVLRRWRSYPRRARRSVPDYSSCGGTESAPHAPLRCRGPPADRVGYPWRTASGRGKTHSIKKTRAVRVAAALFPGWYAPVLRGWSKAAVPARAKSQPQNTFLRATVPAAGARFQYVYAKAAPPLPPHTPAHACIRCSGGDRPKWKPFPGWWCDPRSVSGSIPPTHESAENDWSGLCLRAAVRAAGVRSQYKEIRTG